MLQSCVNIKLVLLVIFSSCYGYYEGDDVEGGPVNWYKIYPDCGGLMQSPVNIVSKEVEYNKKLKVFDFTNYGKADNKLKLKNKVKHSMKLEHYKGDDIIVTGGSLPDKYSFLQVHFHWGKRGSPGSEHVMNGVGYPLEMHLVHKLWHQSAGNASAHPFGLAVIGYFIENWGEDNPSMEAFLTNLEQTSGPADVRDDIPFSLVKNLIPDNERHDAHYLRYWGSLTTPPCSETVIWSVATEHILISDNQYNRFKSFLEKMNQTMSNNYRPPQQLNYRQVYSSDPKFKENNCRSDGVTIVGSTSAVALVFVGLVTAVARRFV